MKSKRELAAENAALRQRLNALSPDSRKGLRRLIETQKQQIKAHDDVLKERDTSIKKLQEDLDAAHGIIKSVQDALGTGETGAALALVARNAHSAEQALAAQTKKEEAEPADDALAKAAQSLQDGKKGNGNGKKRSAKSST